MSSATHPSLLLRLRNREDASAWEEFFALYHPLLVRVARMRGLQAADADEVAQDVLVAVVQTLNEYKPTGQTGSFRAWLRTIANRRAINRLVRDGKHRGSGRTDVLEQLANQPVPVDTELERELQIQWRRQLFIAAGQSVQPTCSPTTWQAFWRSAVLNESPAHIADDLKISLGSVYVARSRVQMKIREWVDSQSSRWNEGGS